MTPLSVNSAALLILQQSALAANAPENAAPTVDSLVAAANGRSGEQISGADARTTGLQSKVADSLFDASTPNVTQMKLDLFERTGKALGIERSDFTSMADYGAAIKIAIGTLRLEPDADRIIRGIEKELGLDKLGVSLDTVVAAIMGSDDDVERLDKAMLEAARKAAPDPAALLSGPDDIGLYTASLA